MAQLLGDVKRNEKPLVDPVQSWLTGENYSACSWPVAVGYYPHSTNTQGTGGGACKAQGQLEQACFPPWVSTKRQQGTLNRERVRARLTRHASFSHPASSCDEEGNLFMLRFLFSNETFPLVPSMPQNVATVIQLGT